MEPDELHERLEYTRRIERVRSTYHWVIGEAIRFRLAFTDAPEIFASEDIASGTVTARLGNAELTLVAGGNYQSDTSAIRAWIESLVDLNRLSRSKHRAPGASYWTTRATRW